MFEATPPTSATLPKIYTKDYDTPFNYPVIFCVSIGTSVASLLRIVIPWEHLTIVLDYFGVKLSRFLGLWRNRAETVDFDQ